MYPRWQIDDQNAPPCPPGTGTAQPPSSRIGFGPASVLDLEGQINAELDGASWAVLAFAPEDALWADWLYRNLNGYPVPATMIDSVTSHGLPRPDCVSIFPDRRDPQYAGHYPQALKTSGYLVVVCSPRSAHCPEVDARICAFKSAGGEERIIALVVEGGPDGALEQAPKSATPEWLPAWLRWRLADDTFAVADRAEPLIVDARPGRAGLKETRDRLLSALLEMDAWELEVEGWLARPVEMVRAAPPAPSPAALPVPPPQPRAAVAPPRKIGPIMLAVALCVSVTLGTAWWSFGRIERDRTRTLSAPVRVVAKKTPPQQTRHRAAPQPPPSAELISPPGETASPAPEETEIAASVPSVPVAPMAQIAVPPVSAQPPGVPAAPPEETASRHEMVALHHRGDDAVGQRQLDEALGFYEQAVDSARATPRSATPDSRTEAALLYRKLGTLQLQMASTAEARTSFVQGRKLLLQVKKEGHWNAARARVLAEIETSLRRLPRD